MAMEFFLVFSNKPNRGVYIDIYETLSESTSLAVCCIPRFRAGILEVVINWRSIQRGALKFIFSHCSPDSGNAIKEHFIKFSCLVPTQGRGISF
jgi:hypothetical protein